MGTISVSLPSDGSTADVSDYNSPINTIVDEINGNLDNANIDAAAAIAGSKLASGGVGTTQLADGAVTPAKLDLDPGSNTVATSETTTSTSYTDLATVQATTVTVGANGLALVAISSTMSNSNTEVSVWASFAMSGANTLAAADANGITHRQTTATSQTRVGMTKLFTGLTPGSTTFTMKFKTIANTGTWLDRNITVIPL